MSLLAVSFIGEKIKAATDVEITDTTGVGEIESFVNRITHTTKKISAQNRFDRIFIFFPEILITPLVFVILRITIDTEICAETCFRS